MLFVFVIQAAVMVAMFLSSDILKKSSDNAYGVLSEKVLNRKMIIENEMVNRWTRIADLHEQVLKVIQAELSQNNIEIYQLADRPDLQNRILDILLPQLIYIIRRNYVTGVFLVIDAPTPQVKINEFVYPGLYVRNDDPASYSSSNEDILVSRGPAEVIQKHNIALGVDWSPFFTISRNSRETAYRYFNAPIVAALRYPNEPIKNLGFWSHSFKLDPLSNEVITYSVPIKDKQGNVYGVLGIDLSTKYIQSFLNFDELDLLKEGIYCIAVNDRNDSSQTFLPIVFNSAANNLGVNNLPIFKKVNDEHRYGNTIDEDQAFADKYSLAIEPFRLYQNNGMYENEEWVLIGLSPETNVLLFSVTIKNILEIYFCFKFFIFIGFIFIE